MPYSRLTSLTLWLLAILAVLVAGAVFFAVTPTQNADALTCSWQTTQITWQLQCASGHWEGGWKIISGKPVWTGDWRWVCDSYKWVQVTTTTNNSQTCPANTISSCNYTSTCSETGSRTVTGYSCNPGCVSNTDTNTVPSCNRSTAGNSCSLSGGTGTCQNGTCQVRPELTIAASPARVTSGDSVTVVWSSSGVSSCIAIGDGWTGNQDSAFTSIATNGARVIQMSGGSNFASFYISCSGSGGSASGSASVWVEKLQPPTVTIQADPTRITSGESTTITWSTRNADSCTAIGTVPQWRGTKASQGSQTIQLEGDDEWHGFFLNCSNAAGTTARHVQVFVDRLFEIDFTSDRKEVQSGENIRLQWELRQ